MHRFHAAAAAALILSGCATTSGTDATEKRSGFDGARVVNVPPHATACAEFTCIALGAQWSQAAPAGAVLEVAIINAYRPILRAELAIDGRVVPLTSVGITTFPTLPAPMRESRKAFGTTMQAVRDLAAARKAWIRVHTPEGYIESAIVDGATDSKALHALRRFLARVDAGG